MVLTGAENIKKWQAYTEELYEKDLHHPDNHDGVITNLEPDILECEGKWALGSITMNKASGCAGIAVQAFQNLKDDAVKVLHSICQQIWNSQQWPQDWSSDLNILWSDWCWSWNSKTLAPWSKELTQWKTPWCWERLKAGGEGDDRGWGGWMSSLA